MQNWVKVFFWVKESVKGQDQSYWKYMDKRSSAEFWVNNTDKMNSSAFWYSAELIIYENAVNFLMYFGLIKMLAAKPFFSFLKGIWI